MRFVPFIEKYCCVNCFEDPFIKEYITENGEIRNCEFCGSEHVNCIEASDLGELFLPLYRYYTPIIEFMGLEEMKQYSFLDQKFFWDYLSLGWEILSDKICVLGLEEELTRAIMMSVLDPIDDSLEDLLEDEREYFGISLSPDNYNDLWDVMENELKHDNRFFPSNVTIQILEGIKHIFPSHIMPLSSHSKFYRSRVSNVDEDENPVLYFKEEMSAPPKEKANFGRANPTGIRYLYVATDSDTAIAEIRPELDQSVTIGEFHPIRDIRILDLTSIKTSPFEYGDRLKEVYEFIILLVRLDDALSKPVTSDIAEIAYVTSQYLCEFIKRTGFCEGILYKSTRGPGNNLLCFDPGIMECVSTSLHKITEITYIHD